MPSTRLTELGSDPASLAAMWSALAPEPGVRPVDVVRTWERLGVDPGRVGDVGLTAAGSHDPAVLRTLRRDAEELTARLAELRG